MTSPGRHRDRLWTQVARTQPEFTAHDHEFTRSM